MLVRDSKWKSACQVGLEAIGNLSFDKVCSTLATLLIETAMKCGNNSAMILGRKALFYSEPGEYHLRIWICDLEEAERQEQIQAAIDWLEKEKQPLKKCLQVKMMMMLGQISLVMGKVKNEKTIIGWSCVDEPVGIVFSSILFALVDGNQKAKIIQQNMSRYIDENDSFSLALDSDDRDETIPKISKYIVEALKKFDLKEKEREIYWSWAKDIGWKRVEDIVSNKHRRAYKRASEVLGALAETFVLMGMSEKATAMIDEFRNVKFNRHVAFKRELDDVIKVTDLF